MSGLNGSGLSFSVRQLTIMSLTKSQRLRLLLFATALLSTITVYKANSQHINEPSRMSLDVSCPNYTIAPQKTITLFADVPGEIEALGELEANRVTYHWQVIGAEVLAGQKTAKITIKPKSTFSGKIIMISAKVSLSGIPPYFIQQKSCTIQIDNSCAQPELVDEYSVLSLSEEQPHLDKIAKRMNKGQTHSVVFIVVYAGRESCLWEADFRGKKAKDYLVERYNIPPDRIVTVDGGYRSDMTVSLFLASKRTCGPFPTPTIMGSRTRGLRSCDEKYRDERVLIRIDKQKPYEERDRNGANTNTARYGLGA
jgi:hypothetical protein